MTMPNTAWDMQLFDISGIVGATSMATNQYKCVKMHTDGTIVLAASGSASLGIMKDNNGVGQPCTIAVLGIYPAVAGANIASGVANPMVALTCDSDSGVKAATSGDVVVGYSLEPMSVAGEIHPILILPRMQAGSLPAVTEGQTLYGSGTSWAALAAGTQGKQLNMGAADPAWGNTAAFTTFSFQMPLASIAAGGHALVTTFIPGFAGTITKWCAICNTACTGSDGTGTAITIATTSGTVTGGVITLKSTNMDVVGKVVESATGITQSGNYAFTAAESITITAAAGTAFTAGDVTFVVTLKPTVVVI